MSEMEGMFLTKEEIRAIVFWLSGHGANEQWIDGYKRKQIEEVYNKMNSAFGERPLFSPKKWKWKQEAKR